MVGSVVGAGLVNLFQLGRSRAGGWWILDELEVHFVHTIEVDVPDLAGWQRERMTSLPDDHRFKVIPDWACETFSPGTSLYNREIKMLAYGGHGVGRLWLIDPASQHLQIYGNGDGSWRFMTKFNAEELNNALPISDVIL